MIETLVALAVITNMVRFDAVVSGVTPSLPIPAGSGETISLNNVEYYRYYFVGKCWQPEIGGLCGSTSTPAASMVPMVKLVVGVIWTESSCPYAMCIRATTGLFSNDPNDPVFGP